MLKKLFVGVLVSAMAVLSLSGCTRVDDGYVGISKGRFSGEIEQQILTTGWKQTLTQEITQVSTRNIIINVAERPVIKEGIPMDKFQIKVNYGIVPQYAPFIYKSESNQHLVNPENEDIYLLGGYVETIASASIKDVVTNYTAMEVNLHREKIEKEIKDQMALRLTQKGKAKYVNINEINILTVEPPKSIVQSVEAIIKTENDKKAKVNEVETAKLEQERMQILSKSAGKEFTDLLNAQANDKMATALVESAKQGKLLPILVPHNFNGNVTISK